MSMKKFVKSTITTLLLGTTIIASNAIAYEKDKTYKITILHLNDTHGHFWSDKRDQYGFPAIKTIVDKIRKEGNTVLFLHAGDLNTGVPESDILLAEPDIVGLNAMDLDVMVLGNHEFDFPVETLLNQKKQAKFPFISANTEFTKDGKPIKYFEPYFEIKRDGLKFLIVGLTTPDTKLISKPENVANVNFTNPVEASKKAISDYNNKNGKADVTIALSHLGYYPYGNHGQNYPGDVSLAKNLPHKTFDLIIAGHTHIPTCFDDNGVYIEKYIPGTACKPDHQNGTYIVQAKRWGEYLGRADFEFKNGETKLVNYELIPINLKYKNKDKEYQLYQTEIQKDPELFEVLKKYNDASKEKFMVKVGTLKGNLNPGRGQATLIGSFIAGVQKQRAKADIGIVNSGGIRDSLSNGDITYRDILTVQPFGNSITVIKLKGKELKEYLTKVALIQANSGGFAQFSGVTMLVNTDKQTVSNILVAGKPINNDKVYVVSVPDFLAAGGDKYPVVTNHPSYFNTGYIDAEVLKDYFEQHKVVNTSNYKIEGIKFQK